MTLFRNGVSSWFRAAWGQAPHDLLACCMLWHGGDGAKPLALALHVGPRLGPRKVWVRSTPDVYFHGPPTVILQGQWLLFYFLLIVVFFGLQNDVSRLCLIWWL